MADARDQALLQAIEACGQQGDVNGARNYFQAFLGHTSDATRQAPARIALGRIEQRSGHPQTAVALYTEALQTDRRNAQLMLQLGFAHFEMGQWNEAERCYRAALRLEPRLPRGHYNLGILLQQKREHAAACRAFEAALIHQPQFPEALNNLANTLSAMGEFARAEKCYRDAIALRQAFFQAHQGLGVLLVKCHRRREALTSFSAAVQHNPDFLDGWLELAECQMQLGDSRAALVSVDAVLAHDANHSIARYRRALYSGEQLDAMPTELVTKLYAGMAATFDEHLVARLGYQTPLHLKAALAPWLDACATRPRVIDLGCGTGLFGVQIRPWAAHLIGVDLSAEMLDAARARGLYDALSEGDLVPFLNAQAETCDLIAATDVLIYLGNLTPLFAAVAKRLDVGGAFAFSTEAPDDLHDGICLQGNGRFAHSRRYITDLAELHGLQVLYCEPTVIRSENAVAVKGWLVVLGKVKG